MKYYNHTLALFLLLVTTVACNKDRSNNNNEIASPVSVTEIKNGSISKFINTTGTAMANKETVLTSQMSGLYKLQNNPATGRPFKLGDRVRAGQVIIRLEDKEYENGISIESKKLNLEIVEQEQKKQKALYEKGGVTLSEMRNSEVKMLNAELEYENAELKLDYMVVKAPFDGIIVDLPHYTSNVKVDQGKNMASIMSYDQMYMEINLPESSINDIKPGQKANITHYTLPYDTISGQISELSPAISSETRTFKGKLLIDNSKLLLRPGMFVKADIVVDHADSTIVIPKEVILSNRRRKYVYVVEKNVAVIRDIKIGLEDEDNVEIVNGLKPGDNLVTKGYETLRENSKVKVMK